MNKNFIYGAGALGIIGIAVYIYQEHKKAKKTEQESVIYIDGEATENDADEQQEKETKKNAISEKIANVSHKIGKTVGTVALKIGAKYPKAVKFVCKYGKFLPIVVIAGCTIMAAKQSEKSRSITNDSIHIERDVPLEDPNINSPLYVDTYGVNASDAINLWKSTDLSSNYAKINEFFNTLNLAYSEHYEIENKESYIDSHPGYDFSEVPGNFILRQSFNTNEIAKRLS